LPRTALYARVSTNDQDADLQLREFREFCQRRNWTVAGEYIDTGISGSKNRRPELDQLMADKNGDMILNLCQQDFHVFEDESNSGSNISESAADRFRNRCEW
jgi:DNA invertase Pin-like site-specific DNA recombinase